MDINTSPNVFVRVPQPKTDPETKNTTVESESKQPSNSNVLQPDQVEISKEGQEKSLQELGKKRIEEQEEVEEKEMTAEEKLQAEDSQLDKDISDLSLEILEISIQIELLRSKEDAESVKEMRSLEVDLAIKEGILEAMITRKSDVAKLISYAET